MDVSKSRTDASDTDTFDLLFWNEIIFEEKCINVDNLISMSKIIIESCSDWSETK